MGDFHPSTVALKTERGWALSSGHIKVHCIQKDDGTKVVSLEVPFDELRYQDLQSLIGLLWRARAWMGAKTSTTLSNPPLVVEPPDIAGYVRARHLYEFHGPQRFLEALKDVIRDTISQTKIKPR